MGGVGAVGVVLARAVAVAEPAWMAVARVVAPAKDRVSVGVGGVLDGAGVVGTTAVVAVECGPTAHPQLLV